MLNNLDYEEHRLENGLRVIMHVDRSTPVAAVNVWYHVGSQNEAPGKTGFAHLFEHLMFQGSKNYNSEYFKPLQEAGAMINGSTTADRTNYYEVVPSNFLELALFMEADRMGGLLDAMTQEKLDNQRDVVKNERRQRYDNQPYGTAFEKISELIYPPSHPYSWTTIGSMEDLSKASMDDVKQFFRTYYAPNNASLVIAGDFEPAKALELVKKHFGNIPRGADFQRPLPELPEIKGEMRAEFEDNVQLPRVYMAWHTVPLGHEDEAPLDILSTILTLGRGSRLQKSLVFEGELAQNIGAFNYGRTLAGQFQITATARPNVTLERLEAEINRQIELLHNQPPTTDEVERAVNSHEAGFVFGLQNVNSKADWINHYATFFEKPERINEDLARIIAVKPEDVQRVAQKYLTPNRLVMHIVPHKEKGKNKSAAPEAEENTAKIKEKVDDSEQLAKLPKADGEAAFRLPEIEKWQLSNGLQIAFVRRDGLPLISLSLLVKAGAANDSAAKSGRAQAAATLLLNGTNKRSAVEISNDIQKIGASFNTGADYDFVMVSASTLSKHFDKALEIFADILLDPTFPADELEIYRQRALVGIMQRRDNPNAIASIVQNALIYGKNHPYGADLTGTEETLQSLTREDLKDFYENYFAPDNSVLIVVGDITRDELNAKLEKTFAEWNARAIKKQEFEPLAEFDQSGIYIVDKPDSAQSVIAIGQSGVKRDNPDYFPLIMLNSLLGGQFTSRINMNLREEKGFTYGARTAFSMRVHGGLFYAGADVQTEVTAEAVREFLKEIEGVRQTLPVTESELEYNKQSLIRSYPSTFETNKQIASQITALIGHHLAEDWFSRFIDNIKAVTVEDVTRVANQYLKPEKLAILVVGDRQKVEPALREIKPYGEKITYLDADGGEIKQ